MRTVHQFVAFLVILRHHKLLVTRMVDSRDERLVKQAGVYPQEGAQRLSLKIKRTMAANPVEGQTTTYPYVLERIHTSQACTATRFDGDKDELQ